MRTHLRLDLRQANDSRTHPIFIVIPVNHLTQPPSQRAEERPRAQGDDWVWLVHTVSQAPKMFRPIGIHRIKGTAERDICRGWVRTTIDCNVVGRSAARPALDPHPRLAARRGGADGPPARCSGRDSVEGSHPSPCAWTVDCAGESRYGGDDAAGLLPPPNGSAAWPGRKSNR